MPRGSFLSPLRERLIGTWDRVLATVSILASLVSTFATIFLVTNPENIPPYLITRDLTVLLALISLYSFLLIKFLRREHAYSNQLLFLSNQFKNSHDLNHAFRNQVFRAYFDQNIKYIFTDDEYKIFLDVCAYITDSVKKSLLGYFGSAGIDIGKDLSISVKLILPPEEILSRLRNIKPGVREKIPTSDRWVVTAYRDRETFLYNKKKGNT